MKNDKASNGVATKLKQHKFNKMVPPIRQFHSQVVRTDKTITDAGKEQIRAAYKCGQLLDKAKAAVRSGRWGKFCKQCGMSEDTAGRYIKLSKSAGLRDLIKKYRTLNAAYQGEGITHAPRQQIKTITPPQSSSAAVPTKRHNGGGNGNEHGRNPARRNGDGSSSTGSESPLTHHNGNGNDGINLKAKIKGGGNLGDLMGKVSPAARADIKLQLQGTANSGGQVPKPNASIVVRLVEALLLQLNQSAERNDPAEVAACASSIKPVIEWYKKHVAKPDVALAA